MTPEDFRRGPVRITAYDWVPRMVWGLVRDHRLRWALEEAGLDYEVDLVAFGTQAEAENLARQPFGQVPSLTAGGHTIFESGACVWTIAEAGESLLPGDPARRADCLAWTFGALNTIEPALTVLVMLMAFQSTPDKFGVTNPKAADALRPGARNFATLRLTQLAERMNGRDHLVGDRFTVADLVMVSVLRIADWQDLLTETPALKAYVERHAARPAFRTAMDGQIAAFEAHAPNYESAA